MIRVFVETPKGRDSAGFIVPESAAADDVLMALRGQGWSPFALRLDLEQNAWIALVLDWRRAAWSNDSPLRADSTKLPDESKQEDSHDRRSNPHDWWYVLINVKIFVAILLIAAVPAYAQAQGRSTPKVAKGDAQKVATIIRSDKSKTQTYCEINKVSDQMNQAYGKNDKKTVDELSQKIDRLEKILGSEYIALMDGLQKLGPENKKRVAEIMSQFAALDRLCTK